MMVSFVNPKPEGQNPKEIRRLKMKSNGSPKFAPRATVFKFRPLAVVGSPGLEGKH